MHVLITNAKCQSVETQNSTIFMYCCLAFKPQIMSLDVKHNNQSFHIINGIMLINEIVNSLCANRRCIVDIVSHSCANQRCIVDIRTNVCFAIGSPVMKLFKFPMRDNSRYIISHSYTKISQTGTQFPMHPLKTISTVKMAWHNRGKRSGTQ